MPNRAVIKIVQNREFLVCQPADDVRTVAAHMKRHGQAAVLVVSPEGLLLGICTERDLAYKVLAEGLDGTTPVSAVMTPEPRTVPPEMIFGHVLHLMYEGGFRHMPVVDSGGRPLGLVSARDALGLEMISFAGEMAQREALAEVL